MAELDIEEIQQDLTDTWASPGIGWRYFSKIKSSKIDSWLDKMAAKYNDDSAEQKSLFKKELQRAKKVKSVKRPPVPSKAQYNNPCTLLCLPESEAALAKKLVKFCKDTLHLKPVYVS